MEDYNFIRRYVLLAIRISFDSLGVNWIIMFPLSVCIITISPGKRRKSLCFTAFRCMNDVSQDDISLHIVTKI